MDDAANKKDRKIECLIADFGAIKSEIARRSSLQRVVLAAHIGIIAYIVQNAISKETSYIWVFVIWLTALLSTNFYFREDLEIHRLGRIIETKISKYISEHINVPEGELFPSEETYEKKYLKFTKKYDFEFNWIVFLLFPFALSSYIIINDKRIICTIGNFRASSALLLLFTCAALIRT